MTTSQFRLWHLFAAFAAIGVVLTGLRWSPDVFSVIVGFGFVAAVQWFIWTRYWKPPKRNPGRLAYFAAGALLFLSFGAVLSLVVRESIIIPVGEGFGGVGHRRASIHQLGLAIRNYEARNGAPLPRVLYDGAGRPMHSWRALILRDLEEAAIHQEYRFEEPWSSPHNLAVASKGTPYALRSPGDGSAWSQGTTSFLAVYDPKLPPIRERGLGDLPPGAPRVMLVEVDDSKVLWSEPRDLPYDQLPEWQEGRKLPRGLIALLQDGRAVHVPRDVRQLVPPK